MRSKDESKIILIGENMNTLIGETLKMAVIDSGFIKQFVEISFANLKPN